jgi:zinc and cadmium transporter
MEKIWGFALISTIVVSLISLIGVFLLAMNQRKLQHLLIYLISFSVGALLGNAFFHLVPEAYFHFESAKTTSWLIVGGFIVFFLVEQLLHSHQVDVRNENKAIKTYGYLSLYADGIHNFTDGILIGAAWLFSPELGIATTTTVILHEIPQEISDFGILLKAGFTKKKALLYNFFAAISAIFGTVLALWIGHEVEHFSIFILPIAAGGFIYLSASSLLPEIVKNTTKRNWWIHTFIVALGLILMYGFSLTGTHQH